MQTISLGTANRNRKHWMVVQGRWKWSSPRAASRPQSESSATSPAAHFETVGLFS